MSEVEYAECSVCGTGAEVSRLYFECENKSVDAFYLTLCHQCKPRISHPTNDAKKMIAEGLDQLREQPDWNKVIIHLGHAFSMSFNDVESILNNLFEVCKPNEQEN